MSEDRGSATAYGFSGDQDDEQELPPSPKHHKKDTKRYVAFRSDEEDSSEVDFEENPSRFVFYFDIICLIFLHMMTFSSPENTKKIEKI